MKRTIIRWIIGLLAASLLTFIFLLKNNIFNLTDPTEKYKEFTNAFFITGILFSGFGLLLFISNEGMFDIIVYGLKSFFNMFRKDMNKMKYNSFYEYKVSRENKKVPFIHVVVIGIIFVIVSFIFLSLYEKL